MKTLLLILGYLIADSALTDPCENHTVLEDTWRSTDCTGTQCTGLWKCDAGLAQGWYRFKSSGGWEIPETEVPDYRCSTHATGWLKGSHPTVGQGEVKRTVCFTWFANPCYWTQEIKIKNCTSYFVYELKPTPGCIAYCTDPKTVPNQEPEEQSTRESADRSSSSTAWFASSETSPTQEPEEQSTPQSDDRTSTTPMVSTASDPETFPTQEPEDQSTRESADRTSTIPAGSAASDTETSPTKEPEEQSTRESADRTSPIPAGSAASDTETSPTLEPKEQTTPDSADRTTTIPAGSAATDTETFQTEKTEQKSTRVSVYLSSTVPGGSGTSDNRYKRIDVHITSMTEFDDETAKKIALEQVKQMFKDQCPDVKFDLSPDDVQCSASDPPEE